MSPEPIHDPLDKALMLRTAAAPPHGFTAAVLARVNANQRRRPPDELIARYGVGAGLTLAAFGVSLVVNVSHAAAAAAEALRGPEATSVVGVLVIGFVWVLTRKEPEFEAF